MFFFNCCCPWWQRGEGTKEDLPSSFCEPEHFFFPSEETPLLATTARTIYEQIEVAEPPINLDTPAESSDRSGSPRDIGAEAMPRQLVVSTDRSELGTPSSASRVSELSSPFVGNDQATKRSSTVEETLLDLETPAEDPDCRGLTSPRDISADAMPRHLVVSTNQTERGTPSSASGVSDLGSPFVENEQITIHSSPASMPSGSSTTANSGVSEEAASFEGKIVAKLVSQRRQSEKKWFYGEVTGVADVGEENSNLRCLENYIFNIEWNNGKSGQVNKANLDELLDKFEERRAFLQAQVEQAPGVTLTSELTARYMRLRRQTNVMWSWTEIVDGKEEEKNFWDYTLMRDYCDPSQRRP